jgi:phospholipid transport system substrate-binding protein
LRKRSERFTVEATMGKALAAWLLVAATAASSTTPQEVVQSAVTRVVAILQDDELARPANLERRRTELRRVADDLFDFNEMARRALARHWSDRSPQERQEFIRLFTDLLERSYVGKVEMFAGERILYLGETIDGDYAAVRSKIVARKTEIPVEYRLYRNGQHWAVYDILFEGVSFVSTYRSQFNRIIQAYSFAQLMDKMRQKETEVVTVERRTGRSN